MLVYAHRGASNKLPENTLEAFELAITEGADGIEFDVFQHGDEYVVIHDRWLNRTTSGTGNIGDYSLAELQSFDAGNGYRIPTLAEVFELVDGRCRLNLEAKGIDDEKHLTAYVKQCLSDTRCSDEQLLVSSFDHHFLRAFSKVNRQWQLGALTASLPLDYAQFASQLNAHCVHADVSFINKAFVDDAKQRNLTVNVYTVDQQADIQRLFEWGVDGIFSNDPAAAKAYVKTLTSG